MSFRTGSGGVRTLTFLLGALFAISAVMTGCGDDSSSSSDADDIVAVESIAIDKRSAKIAVGEELTLTATITPQNATDKTVTWATGDSSKVTIENGKIKGVAKTEEGEILIVTASAGGKSADCQITVINVQAQDKASTIVPSEKTLSSDAFEGIDATIATIEKTEDGKVNITPKKAEGATTVTVKYSDGTEEVFAITITDGTVSAQVAERVETPTITCNDDNEVTIHCATAGAEIFYTINGDNPTSQSTKYTEKFTITQNTTIKAFAKKAGMVDSGVATRLCEVNKGESETVNVTSADIENLMFEDGKTYVFDDSITQEDFNEVAYKIGCTRYQVNVDFSACKKVTKIPKNAFEDQHELESIKIPDSVTSIEEEAFYKCINLESIEIPDSVESIGIRAFSGCTGLKSIKIPSGVTNIRSYVFEDCSSLTSVIIPNSVTSISDGAFAGTSLTSITIPDSVTSISGYAFTGTSITSITIPASVTHISGISAAFGGCKSLLSIIVNSGNENYSSQDGILFNKSMTVLESYPRGKTDTSYTIPSCVKQIEIAAFQDCSSLKSITIPYGVKDIADDAFKNCSSLTSISIPDSVTYIDGDAFTNCSSLTSITIPSSVRSGLGFIGCTSLSNIVVSNDNEYYSSQDGILFNKDKTTLARYPEGKTDTSYTIPDGVTSIGVSSFRNCSSLESITIPNSVTSIGAGAFYGCSSLSSIIIPSSVTSVGQNAFETWTSEQTIIVWCQEDNKPSGWDSDWKDECNAQIIYNGGQ